MAAANGREVELGDLAGPPALRNLRVVAVDMEHAVDLRGDDQRHLAPATHRPDPTV